MPGKVLVYGGKGGLGHVVVQTFKELGYWVLSVDIVEQPSADHNVVVSLEESPSADPGEDGDHPCLAAGNVSRQHQTVLIF